VARNRLTVAAAMLAMLALVTGGAIAVWQARKAAGERDRALVQLDRAEATNDLSGFLLSEATPTAGRPITNAELLARGEMLVDRRFKDDPALRAHMLLILSERYHENDQFDRWQATVDRAFSLSRSIADAGLRARAACVKAGALDDQGRVDEADRLLSSALQELAVSTDTAADEAYCRICEANMANRRGDAPRAVVAAERAVALEEGRSGPAGRGFEALFLLATAYFVADRCAAADEVFRRLLAMLERHGRDDTRDAALVLNNWSTMLQQAGQPLRALPLSERAVRIARERDSDRGALPVILRSHATALCSVGRCEEAVPFADEAIAKAAASGSIRRRYGALSTAATVHGQAGHLARASELLAEVERVLEAGRAELPAQQAVLERRQAQLALLRGDAGTAATLAARAAAREDDLRQDTTAAIQVMLVLAQAQNTHGNVEAGRAAAERALTIGRVPDGMEHSAWTGQAHLELGVALAGQGHIEESLAELRQALEHLETCAGREAAPTRRALAQLDRLGR
jgi:tetratricopeptide (TPR) repeat protein